MPDTAETEAQLSSPHTGSPAYKSPIDSLKGIARFDEETILKSCLKALPLPDSHSFLDVGCGYGRKMEWLRDLNINATGVDINPVHVQAVRDAGMQALSIEEFDSSNTLYDGILMSHIIEHFTPENLLTFMDHYLSRLKTGGYLVITTPMPWVGFIEDFDHVRPYPPRSITQIFSNPETQVQYHGRAKLKLVDVALRRIPYTPQHTDLMYSNMHQGGFFWKIRFYRYPRLCARLFRLSGGAFGGSTTGWVGVFQKQ